MVDSFLKNDYRANFEPGVTLPKISTKLDSIRAYQFEVKFFGLPPEFTMQQQELTAAAKQVSPIGGSVDDIVVDRLNDKVFYPGKFTPDAVTVTFDNQVLSRNTPALWGWFKSIYDPITGDMTKLSLIPTLKFTVFIQRVLDFPRRITQRMISQPLKLLSDTTLLTTIK